MNPKYDSELKIQYFKARYLRQERRVYKRIKRLTKKILRGHCNREELLKKLALLYYRREQYATKNKYFGKPRLKPIPRCYDCSKIMDYETKYCDSCRRARNSLCKICFGKNEDFFGYACQSCRSKYVDKKGSIDLTAPYNAGLRTVYVLELKRAEDEFAVYREAKEKYGIK